MDESIDGAEAVEATDVALARWIDAGRLAAMIDPQLFESMVRAAESTAMLLSTARCKKIG